MQNCPSDHHVRNYLLLACWDLLVGLHHPTLFRLLVLQNQESKAILRRGMGFGYWIQQRCVVGAAEYGAEHVIRFSALTTLTKQSHNEAENKEYISLYMPSMPYNMIFTSIMYFIYQLYKRMYIFIGQVVMYYFDSLQALARP